MTLDFCQIIGNGFFGGITAVAPETTMSFGITSTTAIDPVITAAALGDSDLIWTKPDGVSTFTGKAPAGSNFDQVGIYKIACTDWSKVVGFNCASDNVNLLTAGVATALASLTATDNVITVLDVSKNILLTLLLYSHNGLTTIDVSSLSVLYLFSCATNQLTSLDVSGKTGLWKISCYSNPGLASLNLTGDIVLTQLSASECALPALDISTNTKLYLVDLSINQLTQNAVDDIFIRLLSNASGGPILLGTAYLGDTGNSPPGEDGLAAAISLAADYGWDVGYN